MKEGQSSRTAEAAAALRANHFKNTTNPVFSDPYAFEMTSKGWKKLLSTPLIVKLMNSPPFKPHLRFIEWAGCVPITLC